MREISGTAGPLHDLTVTRDHGTFSTRYTATGTLDLQKLQTGISSDAGVVASLSNQQVDVNSVDQALLADIRDAFGLQVRVELPGGTTTVRGQSGKTTPIDASTSVLDAKRVVLVVVAIALIALAVVVLVWPGRRRRRARRRPRTS